MQTFKDKRQRELENARELADCKPQRMEAGKKQKPYCAPPPEETVDHLNDENPNQNSFGGRKPTAKHVILEAEQELKPGEKRDYKSAIIGELAKLVSIYQASGERLKAVGYRKTIMHIKAKAGPIHSVEDMNGIKHVGPKVKQKVKELIEDGCISKLQNM